MLERKRKGELHTAGSEDVLTIALETPEHSGRVRGVGNFISPKVFFNFPKKSRITKAELLARDRQRDDEMERTKKEMADLKQLVSVYANIIPSPMLSDKASCRAETNRCKPTAAKELELMENIHLDPPPPEMKVKSICIDTRNNLLDILRP